MEPIGGLRGDWQAATVCAAVMNAAAMRAGSRRRFRVKDFLLVFKNKETPVPEAGGSDDGERQSWQTMKFYARMYAAAANADQQRKRKR